MAAPFVPVPVPIDRAPRADSKARRPQRAASVGSDSSVPDRCFTPPCQSPVTRARLNGIERSVEYSSYPQPEGPPESPGQGWEERPITPTVLGYEVMEERAKFTVSPSDLTLMRLYEVRVWLISSYKDHQEQKKRRRYLSTLTKMCS